MDSICGFKDIGGNNIWRIARKRKKLQLADINLAVTGSGGTIPRPSAGIYMVGGLNVGSVTGNPPIRQI